MRLYTSVLPHQRAPGPSHCLLPLSPPPAPLAPSFRRSHRHTRAVATSSLHSATRPPAPPARSPSTPISAWACPRPLPSPCPHSPSGPDAVQESDGGLGSECDQGERDAEGGAGRGCGTRSALGSPPRRRQRRREARPARGSAESSPVASKSGCATVKSPTFLEPLERHLSGGGWGVFFQVSQQGALCGPSSPGRASRLSAPPPPNDQLPATLLPGAARGWLAAARKQQPGSLLHDN